MKRKILIITGLFIVAIGGYIIFQSVEKKEPNEIQAQDIKKMVYDYSTGNIEGQTASITSKQLIVNDSIVYKLPENEFFLSIAPYIEETHPCAIHSLTGCQGEMTEKEFNVYIDDMDGNVMLDQALKSQSNGFIDLWLPRDKTYRITIEHDGKFAESEISTYENDNTCITTMQLLEKKGV